MLLDNDNGSLTELSDEQLIDFCKKDEKAFCILFSRYASSIRIKARIMSNRTGFDEDDLIQEGIIGLLNAVRTFKSDKNTKFSSYSNTCITNKMKTAIIKNSQNTVLDNDIYNQISYVTDVDPEKILLEKEKIKEIEDNLSHILSSNELTIFRLFLKGSTYNQMARQLNISQKTVDNALQRVRRKLKSVWRADRFSD